MGGIVGITKNEKALDKLFLIVPELSKALHEFLQEYGLEGKECQKQHHELTGGKLWNNDECIQARRCDP